MSAAYVLDAVRAPFGRYGGGLSKVRPDDLGAHVVRALLDRSPQLDPERVDEVLFGDANQAGEDNRNVARMAWLLNGLPTSVSRFDVNRLCGSSLDAAMQASREIETGEARCRAGRRGRVDEPGALDRAQARRAPSRPSRAALLEHARLADGQPEDARPVDDLARRQRREACR